MKNDDKKPPTTLALRAEYTADPAEFLRVLQELHTYCDVNGLKLLRIGALAFVKGWKALEQERENANN